MIIRVQSNLSIIFSLLTAMKEAIIVSFRYFTVLDAAALCEPFWKRTCLLIH